ncbi:flagellar protein FlaG [Clostridium saccharoperbutylacetonicum]|jgi:flagellar protein FlaG|uniref:flagellar protein FlaG n=1 Tax=Clostridium saccharoperbutylacetonicum TaxID=36745 RepID=UPI0009840277|nr:flagellar protein FlaG [Clostridium saccharoperbutylacetonicum]AQR97023.1 flagellar protein FlaG [Clostridium saccharoperbutylacetonicum]NSB32903.1 flagellar protein FlaG [Clostridium saccharoperbutylacetonicum]
MDVNGIRNAINVNNAYNNTGDDNVAADNIKTSDVKQTDKTDINEPNKNPIDKKELDKAMNYLNKFLEPEKTHAEYSIHKDLGTMIIKIVDDKTKETVLEAPPKKILDMIASLLREDGLLDKKV